MTILGPDRQKIDVPKTGPDPFWDAVHEHYLDVPDEELPGLATDAHARRAREHRWKSLAMLALKENAGWPISRISRAFGHDPGHVARCLSKVTDDLREALRLEPTLDPKTQPNRRRYRRDLS